MDFQTNSLKLLDLMQMSTHGVVGVLFFSNKSASSQTFSPGLVCCIFLIYPESKQSILMIKGAQIRQKLYKFRNPISALNSFPSISLGLLCRYQILFNLLRPLKTVIQSHSSTICVCISVGMSSF